MSKRVVAPLSSSFDDIDGRASDERPRRLLWFHRRKSRADAETVFAQSKPTTLPTLSFGRMITHPVHPAAVQFAGTDEIERGRILLSKTDRCK